eukprot:COSAG05_NODE_11054_length_533_cov_0.702765_1_plen_24_part_10
MIHRLLYYTEKIRFSLRQFRYGVL